MAIELLLRIHAAAAPLIFAFNMTTYEMDDLPKDTRSRLQPSPPTSQLNAAPAPPSSQDSEQVWAMAVAIMLVDLHLSCTHSDIYDSMTMLMIPLLFFPRVLLFLMETEKSLTPLERFLSNQLGVLLLALAAGTIMTVYSVRIQYIPDTPPDSRRCHHSIRYKDRGPSFTWSYLHRCIH